MSKVFHIEYTANDKSTKEKFILTSRTIRASEETLPVFEITDSLIEERNKDEPGFFPGRSAYAYMARAAVTFAQHRKILAQWKDSCSTRDPGYISYVHHLMHTAPKSTLVVDLTRQEFKDVSVEFYPRIGFPGYWRTLRSDRIKILKVHLFGNILND